MTQQSNRLGIVLMISTTFIFAAQDTISRHLAETYNVSMIVMIRYWFFAAFVLAVANRLSAPDENVLRPKRLGLQIARGALLAVEICVTVLAFTLLGLVETHAVFASYPLMIAALSGIVLGERVGWRRWTAIGVGFLGLLVILQPGSGVFSPAAIVPLVAAVMFAIYGLLTRYVARWDGHATSFFWTGVTGAVVMTPVGLWVWEPMSGTDWWWMALLCLTGAGGHWLLIRVYEVAEASAVQPYAYFQLLFASALGIAVFNEVLTLNVAIGAAIITAAGIFTLWREAVSQRRQRRAVRSAGGGV